MTINAAMPAVAPNQSYTGTAAATDMTGTAGDFSGTLGNMMNARGTVATESPEIKEVMSAGQSVQNGEAVMTAEQAVLMNQLHKELMMKNAGYANGELIAMLLSSTNNELTQLMSFDGELSEKIAMLIEGTEETEILPSMQSEAADIAPVQTESMDFVPDQTEYEEASDFMTELTKSSDMTEQLISKAEAETADIPTDALNEAEQTMKSADIPEVNGTEDMPEKVTPVNELKTAERQTGTEMAGIPVNAENSATMATDEVVKTASDDIAFTDVTKTDEVAVVKITEGLSGAEKAISAEDNNRIGHQPIDDNITMKISENTAEGYNVSEKTQDIKSVQQEDIAKQSDMAEQTPDMVEEGFDAEIALARAGRRISEKSEEATELAKSISGTKSDSDLETEQKVTVKQELTEGGITENAVKPEFIRKDDARAQTPVKLTVNEAYQIINEKASTNNGKQTFTVELTPETLGKITVKMVSENGKLSVEILTETETAKQLFEARANELANNLRQNDVEIGSYRVETESEQLFNESFDGSSKNPYAERQQSESPDDEDEFERLISEMMGM